MKTRFAPSPTGNLHVGNMRTALFSYLAAKSDSGDFLLRVEDTDLERSEHQYVHNMITVLQTLGLYWDEGIIDSGIKDDDQYYQSNRTDIYTTKYQELLNNGNAYYCFCSADDLAVQRKIQLSRGLPPKYSGKCRNLSKTEVADNIAAGKVAVLRYKMPINEVISFNDLVRGTQNFHSNDIGDFIIKKSDGSATFMFANAIDDALMNVSLVMRGEDHLTNTPRQLHILKTLKLHTPDYAHMSIILGEDRQPLSKRNGSQSITSLLEQGFHPNAILNFLARLGHTYPENILYSLTELSKLFSCNKLVKSAAVFDIQQLLFWQKQVLLSLSAIEFYKYYKDCFDNHNIKYNVELVSLLQQNIVVKDELNKWLKLLLVEHLGYSTDSINIITAAGKDFFTTWLSCMDNENINVKGLYNALNSNLGVKGKQIYLPIRVALTDNAAGMELQNIFTVMGVEKIKQKLNNIINNYF